MQYASLCQWHELQKLRVRCAQFPGKGATVRYRPMACRQQPVIAYVMSCDGQTYTVNLPQTYNAVPAHHSVSICITVASFTTFYRVAQKFTPLNISQSHSVLYWLDTEPRYLQIDDFLYSERRHWILLMGVISNQIIVQKRQFVASSCPVLGKLLLKSN